LLNIKNIAILTFAMNDTIDGQRFFAPPTAAGSSGLITLQMRPY